MNVLDQIYERLEVDAKCHAKLQELFQQFVQRGAESSDKNPLPGLKLEKQLDKDYFEAVFLGRRHRFSFSVFRDSAGALKGRVEVNLVDREGATGISIGEFDFDEAGETSLKSYKNDAVEDFNGLGPFYIILGYIHDSLSGRDPVMVNIKAS